MEIDTLVLSGGSVNGISILGALQYVKDNNMIDNISNFIGTSAGAFACYLLAIGYSPVEIICYICTSGVLEKMKHFNLVAMINGQGASSFSQIQENLEKMTIDKIGQFLTLKDLKTKYGKNLICVTFNVTQGIAEYLSHENFPDLPCLTALRMSANLPFVFEPYKYMNDFYIDGGIVNNFAIDIAEQIGKNILGICLSYEKMNKTDLSNFMQYMFKLMLVPIGYATKSKINSASSKCKILELDCGPDMNFFNFNISSKLKLELFSSGYSNAKDFFNKN